MSVESSPGRDHRASGGPNPGILACASLALFLAGVAAGAIMAGGRPFPSPFQSGTDVAAYFQYHVDAVRLMAMLTFGSAVPLGIYAATAYARLLRLSVGVPGPGIGFFGGISAAVFLMLASLTTWLLSRPEISVDVGITHTLAFFAFLTGGVGYVVGLGLLIAGIAVPGLILGLVPRWLACAGLLIAGLSELSLLSMVAEPMQILLPVGRFAGLLWLIAAGFMLPRRRTEARGRAERRGHPAGSGPDRRKGRPPRMTLAAGARPRVARGATPALTGRHQDSGLHGSPVLPSAPAGGAHRQHCGPRDVLDREQRPQCAELGE